MAIKIWFQLTANTSACLGILKQTLVACLKLEHASNEHDKLIKVDMTLPIPA